MNLAKGAWTLHATVAEDWLEPKCASPLPQITAKESLNVWKLAKYFFLLNLLDFRLQSVEAFTINVVNRGSQ